jgi:hypothetical protein|tara:strand:+ start:5164 stop:5451 length:288 start_codon:yes stop_codon:yes gene_type:complete
MNAEDMVRKYCERNTVALFKSFLMMIEDLQVDHQIHFGKLKYALPKEYHSLIDQSNYFDQDKLQHLRKRTLDIGNEAVRNIEGGFENFTISFEFK